MNRSRLDDNPFFTTEMDEVLRNAVTSSASKRIRWDAIARALPGISGKACRSRWEEIQGYKGLENMALAINQPLKRATNAKGLAGSIDGTTSSTSSRNSTSGRSRSRIRHLLDSHNAAIKHDSVSVSVIFDSKFSRSKKFPQGTEDKKDDIIVIHVCDEARGVNRDFHCKRRVLTRGMKYFRSYLSESASFEDIDISVHCDVHIFQWLMNYINTPEKAPSLDMRNVISILISSDFLQMDTRRLLRSGRVGGDQGLKTDSDDDSRFCVGACVRVFACATRYRTNCQESTVPMQKLQNALHTHPAEGDEVGCPSAENLFVDFYGVATSRHCPSPNWDVRKYLIQLRAHQKYKWRSIYWKIFARLNTLKCRRCGQRYSLTDHDKCVYHPEEPKFDSGLIGKYGCCGKKVPRFAFSEVTGGCVARSHTPLIETENDAKLVELLGAIKKHLNDRDVPGSSSSQTKKRQQGDTIEPAAESNRLHSPKEQTEAVVARFSRYSEPPSLLPTSLPYAPDTCLGSCDLIQFGVKMLQIYLNGGTGAESDEDDDSDADNSMRVRQLTSRGRYGASLSKRRRASKKFPTTIPRVEKGMHSKSQHSKSQHSKSSLQESAPRKQWKVLEIDMAVALFSV
eukprot:jgi/Bigna1/73241/fgenesh1_pg.23_\